MSGAFSIMPGAVVKTTYDTGPYLVVGIQASWTLYCGPCGRAHEVAEPVWNVVGLPVEELRARRPRLRLAYLNGYRQEGDRIVHVQPKHVRETAARDELLTLNPREVRLTQAQVESTVKEVIHMAKQLKAKAKAVRIRAANAKATKERKPKAPKPPKETTVRQVSYVTPGRGFVTAAVFTATDRDREVMGWVHDAMAKAGKDRGSVNVSEVHTLGGEVSGLFVLARYTAEGAKAVVALRRALRDAAKDTLRDAGYIVRR